MQYVIFDKNGKMVLGTYKYHWNSDSFTVGLGSIGYCKKYFGELPFKVAAYLYYKIESTNNILFTSHTYPKDNILTVNLTAKMNITDREVRKMKGFNKYFRGKNITKIEIKDASN
jgi:hypothetical protein